MVCSALSTAATRTATSGAAADADASATLNNLHNAWSETQDVVHSMIIYSYSMLLSSGLCKRRPLGSAACARICSVQWRRDMHDVSRCSLVLVVVNLNGNFP
eukprot:3590427-Pyramimonas_sp.AAC.1